MHLFLSFLSLITLLISPLVVAGQHAANTGVAAALQRQAHTFNGHFQFVNELTGEKLIYEPQGNQIFPGKTGSGSPIFVEQHPRNPWLRFSFGGKDKCLSAAWGGSFDDSAVAYACAVGSQAQSSTLETDKQWWLAIPTSAHIQTRSLDSNEFGSNSTSALEETSPISEDINSVELGDGEAKGNRLEKRRRKSHGRHGRKHRKHGRKGKKPHNSKPHHPGHTFGGKGGAGTSYYIIPVDHIKDMATRALSAYSITSRGIVSTQLGLLQRGNRAQMWKLISA